jgi:HEAT repeat protein
MFAAPQLPRTLEASLRDLGAQKPSVRASAAHDLARHEADAREQVIAGLGKALRDEAGEVRAAAATALADVQGVEALAELLVALEDPDGMVRQMAITALGEIGDPRATERLRRALSDSRAEVRFQAVIAYPRVCASRDAALEALLAATHDDDPLVCHIALRMSEELGEGEVDPRVLARARALVGKGAPEVRVASAILLAQSGDRVGAAVIGEVASGKLKTSVREDEAAAVELSGTLGLTAARTGLEKRAFGGLLGLLRDPFAWHARVALARLGHERATKEILRELGDRDRDVRTLAVAAAGRAGLSAAKETIAAMRGDAGRADPDAVAEALAALEETAAERGATT